MKINLESLKYLYKYLKENEKLEEVFDYKNVDFEDFKQYIINLILDNISYDFGVCVSDYVDFNNLIEKGEWKNDKSK